MEKDMQSKMEPLKYEISVDKKVYIDDLLINVMHLDIKHTTLWQWIHTHSKGGCCCCCCGHGGHPGSTPPIVINPPPTTTPGKPPSPPTVAPNVVVDLKSVRIRPFIVGGTMTIEAYYEWSATGAQNLLVSIQVKSPVTFKDWRDLLTNQQPIDVGNSPLWGQPGEKPFYFRAVAIDQKGNKYYSKITTVG
jgi:hypothetical protein